MINIETNRRDQAVDKQLTRRLSRHIAFLEKELAELDGDIGQATKASPVWCETEALLRGMLRYKCDCAGVAYAEVNGANTTRTCSSCGCCSGPTGLAGLSIRRWTCGEFGADHDRDRNAAQTIARLGCETPCSSGHGSPGF